MSLNNTQLARRKKAQAYVGGTAATLGLTALGAKGVGALAPKATRFANLPAGKLKRIGAKANKLSDNTGIASIGIGGAAGLNAASISAAESKKIKKNDGGGMDFGLSGVRQGEEISKATQYTSRQKKGQAAGAGLVAGGVGAVGAGAVGSLGSAAVGARGDRLRSKNPLTSKPLRPNKAGDFKIAGPAERGAKLGRAASRGTKLSGRSALAGYGAIAGGAALFNASVPKKPKTVTKAFALEDVSKDWDTWNAKRKAENKTRNNRQSSTGYRTTIKEDLDGGKKKLGGGAAAAGVGSAALLAGGETIVRGASNAKAQKQNVGRGTLKPAPRAAKAGRGGVFDISDFGRGAKNAKTAARGARNLRVGARAFSKPVFGATGAAAGLAGSGAADIVQGKLRQRDGRKKRAKAAARKAGVSKSELTPKQKAQAKANARARGTKAGAYDNLRAAGKPMGVGKAFTQQTKNRAKAGATGALALGGGAALAGGTRSAVRGASAMKAGRKILRTGDLGLKDAGGSIKLTPAPDAVRNIGNVLSSRGKSQAIRGAGLAGAGAAGVAGAGVSYKKGKSGVSKAFNSERGRMRRLDGYQSGATAAAGGLAVGAGVAGAKGFKTLKAGTGRIHGPKGPIAISPGALKSGARSAKQAGALGAGALGAGLAAQRISSFKKGSGASYR